MQTSPSTSQVSRCRWFISWQWKLNPCSDQQGLSGKRHMLNDFPRTLKCSRPWSPWLRFTSREHYYNRVAVDCFKTIFMFELKDFTERAWIFIWGREGGRIMTNTSMQLPEDRNIDLENICSCYLPKVLGLGLKYKLTPLQFFFSSIQVFLYASTATHQKLLYSWKAGDNVKHWGMSSQWEFAGVMWYH